MKIFRKITAAALALVMLLLSLVGCSSLGTPVMELGGTEITANMIEFWLSRYKAQFEHYYGEAVRKQYGLDKVDQFWPLVADPATGETYDDVMSGFIYENAQTYLCSLYLFDQFGLSLPASTVEEVDTYIADLCENYASGSKSEFNALLSNYGVSMKILRELYLIDEKVDYLQEYLFGTGGTLGVTKIDKENYYQQNYVRMRQICFFINECPEYDEKGNPVLDKDGYTKYRDMTAAETQEARARAADALKSINSGADFLDVSKEYDENPTDDIYAGGIYMSKDSAMGTDAALEKIYNELQAMEVGQIKLIETENNLHIVEKLELDEGAYDKTANTDFFTFYDAELGALETFEQYLKEPLFLEYIAESLEKYSAEVKIDEELLNKYKLSTVEANYYY
ncbi:MAG: hypothetical protein IJY97_01195 [Clostridia bacterium]|nr:hypothetical protein [Clostridia bacterium]